MTPAELAALEAKCEAATPGPLEASPNSLIGGTWIHRKGERPADVREHREIADVYRDADAAALVACFNAVPALIAELRDARAGWKRAALELDGYESGAPAKGTRLWRSEHELAKARSAHGAACASGSPTRGDPNERIDLHGNTSRGGDDRDAADSSVLSREACAQEGTMTTCSMCGLPGEQHTHEMACVRALVRGITRLTERLMAAEKRINELDNRTGMLVVCR